MRCTLTLLPRLFVVALASTPTLAFSLYKEYSGSTFFNDWTYYNNWDNLTSGYAWYVNESVATTAQLAYVNTAGNAIMRVDNFSTVATGDRNSVRITSNDWYSFGSLFILDLLHMPYGCSVWPSFWTTGTDWPANGEIDVIENVNLVTTNQYALHTTPGCTAVAPPDQLGKVGSTNCALGTNSSEGCTITETKANSYGQGFATAGGGVYALQIDVSGVYIWFWSRPDIPQSLQSATSTAGSAINISDFGNPSAAYTNTSSCDISSKLGPQQLIFDITLCGSWAGLADFYNASCGNTGSTGLCYQNVVGNGSDYDNAFFEVQYLRAYTTASVATSTSSSGSATATTATSTHAATTTGAAASSSSSGSKSSSSSAAIRLRVPSTLLGNPFELMVLAMLSMLWGMGLTLLN